MISSGKSRIGGAESLVLTLRLRLATVSDILQDTIGNYQENGDVNQAAAIALYAILSFIPLFILTVLMAGYIFGANPSIQNDLVEGIKSFHPYFSGDLLTQLGKMDQKRQVLGWVGIISLIWFSSTIFGAIETALNAIFRSRQTRNYFVSKILAIAMIPMAWAIGILSVGVTYVATLVSKQPLVVESLLPYMPLIHGVLFPYALPYLVTVLFFTVVYKVIPTAHIRLGSALAASAVFSALMELAKYFFTWYVANYTRYNVIFGSLETVVILVVWVFYVALILLFCAELIASYGRRDLLLLEKAFMTPGRHPLRLEERLFHKFGRVYHRGAYVFREGDHDKEMFYILEGRVQMEKKAGQVRKVLAELGPGSYFGEMAPLIDVPRTASALAVEESRLAIIDNVTFHALLRQNEEVSLYMLKEFSQRIMHTNAALDELSQSWVRLMILFYFQSRWPLPDGQDPLSDLEGLTGKARPELQDLLQDLGREGALVFREGKIVDFFPDRAWQLYDRPVPVEGS